MELNLPLKKDICLTQAFRSHFLLKEDRKKLKVEKEGSDVYEQNEPQIEKADQGELQLQLSIGVLRWERKFRGKPAISDLGWPFTPSHKSSPYFATYVGSVLQGLLELSSTCSWLDRSVSGQIGRTRRFHLWKAPTPNGLSRCSHFLADPSCKRCTFSRREEGKLSSRSLLVFPSSRKRMKPGEKEMNTLLRNEASSLFFFKAPIRSRSPLLTGSRLISLPLATQMFQFAKFEKSKERRLATELGYGFPIGDPWITDGISPWPFASESVLPSQCPGIHPMHSFRSYLIEDIALERDTKSLPKIEREAIPVRYWSCGFFLLVDFFLRDTLVRAVNPLRQEMRASQSLELPDANNSLEGGLTYSRGKVEPREALLRGRYLAPLHSLQGSKPFFNIEEYGESGQNRLAFLIEQIQEKNHIENAPNPSPSFVEPCISVITGSGKEEGLKHSLRRVLLLLMGGSNISYGHRHPNQGLAQDPTSRSKRKKEAHGAVLKEQLEGIGFNPATGSPYGYLGANEIPDLYSSNNLRLMIKKKEEKELGVGAYITTCLLIKPSWQAPPVRL
ncbi:hypothetical protein Tco_0020591 [Tanacetum coccineum]